MAEMSTTYISTLPTGSAGGSKYLVQDDGNNTTKVTVNDAVAAASLVSSMNTKIGSTALPTTAQTLTGAIAEHESDITALNGNLTWQSVTLTAGSGVTINSSTAYKTGNFLVLYAYVTLTSQVSAYGTILTHGQNTKMSWIAPLYTPAKVPNTSYGVYADATNQTVRASSNTPAGNYQMFCVIPIA